MPAENLILPVETSYSDRNGHGWTPEEKITEVLMSDGTNVVLTSFQNWNSNPNDPENYTAMPYLSDRVSNIVDSDGSYVRPPEENIEKYTREWTHLGRLVCLYSRMKSQGLMLKDIGVPAYTYEDYMAFYANLNDDADYC